MSTSDDDVFYAFCNYYFIMYMNIYCRTITIYKIYFFNYIYKERTWLIKLCTHTDMLESVDDKYVEHVGVTKGEKKALVNSNSRISTC